MVLKSKRILSPGTQIAGYRIEAELGQGAMAVVYRAVQLNLDRRVALKVLSDELAASDEFVGRFFNEARAAAALSHAHIIQAYDAGLTDDQTYYFAMEYVEGETLQQRIRRQGYVRPGPGIDLAIDIADALNYGWQRQRLTHGDIKPENIMINQAEESKLADFGLAKVAGHDFAGSDIMLTPLYAAPEMIRGVHAKDDCRADVYSFGATLYHVFGGTPPYPGEKAQEVLQRHLNEPLEPLRQRNPAVPGRISDLVGSLLAKDPAQRPADWEAVLGELRDIRRALTEPQATRLVTASATPLKLKEVRRATAVRPAPRPRRAATHWLTLLTLLAVLAVGVGGMLLAERALGRRFPRPWSSAAATPTQTPTGPAVTPAAPLPMPAAARATEWAAVRAEVATLGNPERALARLDEFRKRHGTALPDDFSALQTEYEEAVKWRQATQPPLPAEPGAEWVFRRDTEGAAKPAAAAPDTAATPLRVPPPAAPLPAPATPDAPRATVAAAPGLTDAVPVATAPADLRADAFIGFLAPLARLEYTVPLPVESHLEAGQKWLVEFGEDCPERSLVAFCVNRALPALDEALPKLAANSEMLAGAKLPQRDYSRCTVREVTLAGPVLQEQTQHGVMLRSLTWQRLESPLGVILHLSRLVAAKSSTWRDRRPFLALLLFTHNGKLFEEAVAGLPETPEKGEWEALRSALGKATDEGKALRLWQRATDACQQGERTAAYKLLTEMLATRSGVAARYERRATALLGVLGPAVPEVAAGKLVRDAAEVLNADPTAALTKLLLAGARYGDTDFPEKARLERLRRSALSALPLADWVRQPARRHPLQFMVAFAHPPNAGVPSLAMRVYLHVTDGASDLSPRVADTLPLLEGPALAELGDWATASRLQAKLTDTVVDGLPTAVRVGVAYSRALVESRHGAAPLERSLLEALRSSARELAANNDDGQYALLPQILAVEYGLYLRSGEPDVQTYMLAPGGLSARGPVEPRSRLVFDVAALALDRRQSEALARLVPAVFGEPPSVAEWGLTEADLRLLGASLATSRDAAALAAAMAGIPSRELNEGHLRLAAAAAMLRGSFNDAVWLQATEWVDLKGSTFGPVGGSAIFDLVVVRVSHLLAAGHDGRALEAVNWALAAPHPCLAPYYARLLFLRWGILRLHAGGGGRELGDQVEAAACASRGEKALSRLYVSDALREKARETVKDSPAERFWFDWLVTCEHLGRRPADGAAVERLATARLPRAEQALGDALFERPGGASPAADH